MSFWDHIKPSKPPPVATAVERSSDRRTLTLTWDDGKVTQVSAKTLRGLCPCAACVDEWTHVRRHDPEKVPETTTLETLQPVGNYAVSFVFSDGHSTGIFHWTFLREHSTPT
jgi:DUF971 family protein